MTDFYQAPTADLNLPPARSSGFGSIADGLAGNYQISIGAIFSEAWAKISGLKGTLWLAWVFSIVPIMLVSAAINFILGKFGILVKPAGASTTHLFSSYTLISQFLQLFVTLPLAAGLLMLCIKLAVGVPVEATEVFKYFKKVLPLVGATLLVYVLIILGTCLLILPGIYLAIAYSLAIQLVVEKNLGIWEALETSRKSITHHWFSLFGLYIVLVLIVIVSIIPLGIGLIWTLPFLYLVVGIVYRTIFGYDGAELSESSIAS
jgi:uncharacterized membrane protein